MRTENIRWQSFERSALPRALFGTPTGGVRGWHLGEALESGRGIALGYPEEPRDDAYSPPAVILLDDEGAAETLSWLKSFAPETSPLSQFARVVLRSDWERFGKERPWHISAATREDRWACMVLGELLAQGESDVELPALPLSWSASCFSTAVARSMIMYSEEARDVCIERLLTLEKDQRFARRQVAIAFLKPVWMAAIHRGRESLEIPGVVEMVMSEAVRCTDGPPSPKLRPETLFHARSDFMSDSVESRVVAFQRLTAQMNDETGDRTPTALAHAVIAAGAFLVGRGSSHAFLLSRLQRRWSQTFTWFGLMTGLAGSQSWDGEWSHAAKGIERVLRGKFDYCGSSGADLSWPEYSWLAATFSGKQTFADLPKMAPRALSVEVLPGAACQLRLAADPGASGRDLTRGERVEAERRERELRDTLDQVADLAIRARQLVAGEQSQHAPGQPSLGFDDHPERDSTTSRSRRNKRR